jgi:hypothetical protein
MLTEYFPLNFEQEIKKRRDTRKLNFIDETDLLELLKNAISGLAYL